MPRTPIVTVVVILSDSDTEVRVYKGMVQKRKAKGWAMRDAGLDELDEDGPTVAVYHEPVMDISKKKSRTL